MKTTIDMAGRMVIPKPIREQAGLQPGVELEIREEDGVVLIRVAAPAGRLVGKDGLPIWESAGPQVTLDEINSAIQSVRDSRG